MKKTQVCIVGSGPTGLFMALLLAKYGITCTIIDQNEERTTHSKALVIQSRTLEIFDSIGIVQDFLSQGKVLDKVTVHSEGGILGSVSFQGIDSPYPFVLSLPQEKTEEILEKHLNKHGIYVMRQHQLISFSQDANVINSSIHNLETGESLNLCSDWLIAADGAHSLIRKKLDIPFYGKSIKEKFSLADITFEGQVPLDQLSVFLNQQGVMAIIPFAEQNKARFIYERPDQNRHQKPCEKDIEKKLRSYIPKLQVEKVHWSANFSIHSRLIKTYRKNRIFLAGDAAHIHSPIGGQGMNTGLQDVYNLAWKLAFVIQKRASLNLLNSYEQERLPIAKNLLKATEEASKAAMIKNNLLIRLRNFAYKWILYFPSISGKIAKAISQTAIHYKMSSFFKEKGSFKSSIQLGSRIPNLTITPQEKIFDRMRHQRDFLVLVFSKSPSYAFQELKQFCFCHPSIEYIHVDPEETATYLAAGIDLEGVYLIRPDGILAYRQTSLSLYALKAFMQCYGISS